MPGSCCWGYKLKMLKNQIYNLVEKGSHGSRRNLIFDYCIIILILLNVVAIIIESSKNLSESFVLFLWYFEIFSVVVFSIEYLMRIYVSDLTHPSSSKFKSALKFIFSFYGLIDFLAIAPFFIPFIIKIDLRFMRILRLTRFLRILKMNRYNNSMLLIATVVKERKQELTMTGFVAFLVLLVSSFLMYHVEGEVQPEMFSTVLSAFWWAVATLTTVGYGDIYPVTALGKFISGVIAVLGIGIIALPTGIISAGFIDRLKKKEKVTKCPHCGKGIHE
jgi:voltage-gated potassium channel